MGVDVCVSVSHKDTLPRIPLPGVEEQKAIKSFSIWAFLMASSSKSSGASKEVHPESAPESFSHTTPWFSGKKSSVCVCFYYHLSNLASKVLLNCITFLFVFFVHIHTCYFKILQNIELRDNVCFYKLFIHAFTLRTILFFKI